MKHLSFTNKLRIACALIILLGMSYAAIAQSAKPVYKIQGDSLVRIDKGASVKAKPVDTGKTLTIKGVKYPVYKTPRNAYFIIRTSKKTGKHYKQYRKVKD